MTQTLSALVASLKSNLKPVTSSPEQARAEIGLMLEELLHLLPDALYTDGDRVLDDDALTKVAHVITQRVEKRIPIQYLLHRAHFYGLSFYVNPAVLIPRPETELLVEAVLADTAPGERILDVGTGPGTIALALASRLESCEIVAVDCSKDALKVARLNRKMLAERLKVDVDFRSPGDWFEPVAKNERFDAIVSNPPYIAEHQKTEMAPEVLWHEPKLALFPPSEADTDPDALHYYHRMATEAPAHLAPGGRVYMELGAGQADAVSALFKQAGFSDVTVTADYAGLPRVLRAVWR